MQERPGEIKYHASAFASRISASPMRFGDQVARRGPSGGGSCACGGIFGCGKSQKCLAARRASRTVPETAVMATKLTRLCVAIDSVEEPQASGRFAFAFLRFDFCDARIAFPRRRVRLLGSLTLTLSLSSFVPDLRATMAWLRT